VKAATEVRPQRPTRGARRTLGCLALVAALALQAPPARAQEIRGHVTDGQSERPLSGVTVEVLGQHDSVAAHTETAADGQYHLRVVQRGEYQARFLLPGYRSVLTTPFKLAEGQTTDISPRLARLAALGLDTVVVYGQPVPHYLEDFYRRRRWGWGHFLTRADIERRGALVMSDVLRGLGGVHLACGGRGCDVLMTAANTMFIRGVCRPSVILDGAVLRVGGVGSGGGSVDGLLNPFDIEAVEVYPSAAGVPVQYGGYMSPCGAIVAWSRR
jgi:Carboxypeptidase regulatory-like domain/TonB-dependent Receptor Plug Domain